MRARTVLVPIKLVLAALLLSLCLSPTAQSAEFAPGHLLVSFKTGVGQERAARVLAEHGAHQLRTIPRIGVRVVSVPAAQTEKARAALARNPAVVFAEQDAVAKPQE